VITQEELVTKLAAKAPQLEKAAVQVKDYLTMKLRTADELLPVARALKNDLGFDYLEIVTAVDWLGPVSPDGFIRNPNPNVFLPDGATPQNFPGATPNFPYRPALELIWAFGNLAERSRIFIRLELPRDGARVPSLTSLFKAADWQERETYDLYGVIFDGHPNLHKILTPDFTQGHPLRKDYVHIKDKYDE
jgi:NADH:ubiquinone oxidoreductase subunit C